jgi:hypothetical protein
LGETSNNYELILMQFSDLFLWLLTYKTYNYRNIFFEDATT